MVKEWDFKAEKDFLQWCSTVTKKYDIVIENCKQIKRNLKEIKYSTLFLLRLMAIIGLFQCEQWCIPMQN